MVGCLCGYLSGVGCRFAYGPADATATQSLAPVKSRLVLVPAHPGNTRQNPENCKTCLCVCVCPCMFAVCVIDSDITDMLKIIN